VRSSKVRAVPILPVKPATRLEIAMRGALDPESVHGPINTGQATTIGRNELGFVFDAADWRTCDRDGSRASGDLSSWITAVKRPDTSAQWVDLRRRSTRQQNHSLARAYERSSAWPIGLKAMPRMLPFGKFAVTLLTQSNHTLPYRLVCSTGLWRMMNRLSRKIFAARGSNQIA